MTPTEALRAEIELTGHGHVVPRKDGHKMRCGGPALCNRCASDSEQLKAAQNRIPAVGTIPSAEAALPAETFDAATFGRMLASSVRSLNLSVREAARIIGISPATVSRVANGHAPDIESYFKIQRWLAPKLKQVRHLEQDAEDALRTRIAELEAQLSQARAEERERCAETVDNLDDCSPRYIAAAIRSLT